MMCQSGSREVLAADRVRGRAESPLSECQATFASGPRMGEGSKTQRRAQVNGPHQAEDVCVSAVVSTTCFTRHNLFTTKCPRHVGEDTLQFSKGFSCYDMKVFGANKHPTALSLLLSFRAHSKQSRTSETVCPDSISPRLKKSVMLKVAVLHQRVELHYETTRSY